MWLANQKQARRRRPSGRPMLGSCAARMTAPGAMSPLLSLVVRLVGWGQSFRVVLRSRVSLLVPFTKHGLGCKHRTVCPHRTLSIRPYVCWPCMGKDCGIRTRKKDTMVDSKGGHPLAARMLPTSWQENFLESTNQNTIVHKISPK